jgi:hypothetical protein
MEPIPAASVALLAEKHGVVLSTENICEIHCKEDKSLLGDGVIDFQRVKGVLTSLNTEH